MIPRQWSAPSVALLLTIITVVGKKVSRIFVNETPICALRSFNECIQMRRESNYNLVFIMLYVTYFFSRNTGHINLIRCNETT